MLGTLMLLCAALTALISVNGAVAALVPVTVMMSDLAVEAGARPFGFVEFALVGLPLLAGTVLLSLALGPPLLPSRQPESARRDLSRHAETLAAHYGIDDDQTSISHNRGPVEVVIAPRSPFEGSQVFPGMRTESGDLGRHRPRGRPPRGDRGRRADPAPPPHDPARAALLPRPGDLGRHVCPARPQRRAERAG